jgi:hypothetical protein
LAGNGDGTCAIEPFFVGFIGLNNGNGTGSMDSWWEVGLFQKIIGPVEPAAE